MQSNSMHSVLSTLTLLEDKLCDLHLEGIKKPMKSCFLLSVLERDKGLDDSMTNYSDINEHVV